MSENDVICSSASRCINLNDKRVDNCSSRHPHRYNHEECNGMTCPVLKKWVECKRIWRRVETYGDTQPCGEIDPMRD